MKRDTTNTAAALRQVAHLLTALAALGWNGAALDALIRFGSRIRDICAHLGSIVNERANGGEAELRRIMQLLWNDVRRSAGLSPTSLFPPAPDPRFEVLRYLFDLARKDARIKARRSENEWQTAIGFWEKHTRDALPADKSHTLCDYWMSALSPRKLWSLLPAAGAEITELPGQQTHFQSGPFSVPMTRGLHCTEVWFLSLGEIPDGRSFEDIERSEDANFYRADLTVAISLIVLSPHVFKAGQLYVFSDMVLHQGDGGDLYPTAIRKSDDAPVVFSFKRPGPHESYVSVRLPK